MDCHLGIECIHTVDRLPADAKDKSFQFYHKTCIFPFGEQQPEENQDLNCLTSWKSISDNANAKIAFLKCPRGFVMCLQEAFFYSTCSVVRLTFIGIKTIGTLGERAHGEASRMLFVGVCEIKQSLDVLLYVGRR